MKKKESFAERCPELIKEWNYEKNGDLKPEDVNVGYRPKVWWKCDKAHEWLATISNRLHNKRGCPYCHGQLPIAGETDLATVDPKLAKEWHPTKNGMLTPKDVMPNATIKIWWLCERGHEWEVSAHSRHQKNRGCPYCAGRLPIVGETDLATVSPAVAAEWHPELNGDLTPKDVTSQTHKKVWWKCVHGHDWEARVCNRVNNRGCPYCAGRLPIVGETDLATVNPAVAAEWHPDLNGDLTPQDVTAHSNKKVWWHCLKEGHKWEAKIADRTRRNGCPYCSGRLPIAGKTDLATVDPELAKEWHPDLNGDLTPQDVTAKSDKKVWWLCEQGHVWEIKVSHRSRGDNCPYCSGRLPIVGKTDLETVDPVLAKEWHPDLNGDLTPQDVTAKSDKKVWWLCGQGHSWQAKINNRANGRGCPYCAGIYPIVGETDLATVNPELAKEWHPDLNGDLTPQDVTAKSGKKVWWLCEQDHSWQARISARTGGNDCPYCSGRLPIVGETDLATLQPDLIKEWHPTKNGDLTPQDVTEHSTKRVWWLCAQGHDWRAPVGQRVNGAGCKKCYEEQKRRKKPDKIIR